MFPRGPPWFPDVLCVPPWLSGLCLDFQKKRSAGKGAWKGLGREGTWKGPDTTCGDTCVGKGEEERQWWGGEARFPLTPPGTKRSYNEVAKVGHTNDGVAHAVCVAQDKAVIPYVSWDTPTKFK